MEGPRRVDQLEFAILTNEIMQSAFGLKVDEYKQVKALERENRELRQANEILRKASAYFAQAELDRPFKR